MPRPYQYNLGNIKPDGDYSKILDDKVALSSEYAFDGSASGDTWRMKLRGYMGSKCPVLTDLLDWAERFEDLEIPIESVLQLDPGRTQGVDAQKIGGVVWGFLNLCLKGEARASFQQAPMFQGLDGWRRVMFDINKGRDIRLAQLRKVVRNPPHIQRVEDVANGITRFDNIIREYVDAGGTRPGDKELKSDLLDALPNEIREHILWRATDNSDYASFRNHVRSQAHTVLYHRGKLRAPLNEIDTTGFEDDQPDEQLFACPPCSPEAEDYFGAFLKKIGYKGKAAPHGGGEGNSGAPRGGGGASSSRARPRAPSPGRMAPRTRSARRPAERCRGGDRDLIEQLARDHLRKGMNGETRLQPVEDPSLHREKCEG